MTQPSRLERAIGAVLRAGVTVSAASLAAGLVLSFLKIGAASLLFNIGIIVLLMTPVARVIVSVIEYAAEREWVFVGLTVTVLLELIASGVAAMYGRRL